MMFLAAAAPRMVAAQCAPNPDFCEDNALCGVTRNNCGHEVDCGGCSPGPCGTSVCGADSVCYGFVAPDGTACTTEEGVPGVCHDAECVIRAG
jgi:hypothetical protein